MVKGHAIAIRKVATFFGFGIAAATVFVEARQRKAALLAGGCVGSLRVFVAGILLGLGGSALQT